VAPLTYCDRKVYSFLAWFIEEHGYAPTTREIGSHFGWTPNGVVYHLRKLERYGWIKRGEQKARAIRLLKGNECKSDFENGRRGCEPDAR